LTDAIDASAWPVVAIVLDADVDLPAAEEIATELEELLRRGEPVGLVFDYTAAAPDVQQRISMWLAEQVLRHERPIAAGVTVVPHDKVEHMQAVISGGGFSMPFPAWATSTIDQGVAWAQTQMSTATDD
jgi:bifunctional pyridoxal-dependent enzyme with beta-cystathionase and maltose regulon repressor activities